MSINKSFLGIGWGFPPEFNSTSGDVKMVSEEDDIKESIRIILFTAPGERLMNPTFGCALNYFVFNKMDASTLTEIKDEIERAILFFEPRITLDDVIINTDKAYEGILNIEMDYTIRRTNSRRNVVYPFYFNEGTSTHF
ncbi:MAG: GPW/gp25 family protein [Thermodesulfobacteriota bacterium]